MEKISASYNKENLDLWLFQLRKQPTIWPKQTAEKLRDVIQGLSSLERENLHIAWETGLLSGAAAALSSIPSCGGVIAAPFATAAAVHGVKGGFAISQRYAQQSDQRQDLLADTRAFYLQLGVRLLTRYVRVQQASYAASLELKFPSYGPLLSQAKQAKLKIKAVVLRLTAEEILAQLPTAEAQAVDLLLGHPAKDFPPIRRCLRSYDTRKREAMQKEAVRVQALVRALLRPLREVCHYIAESDNAKQKADFSFDALSNSKATEESRLQHRIDSELSWRREAHMQELLRLQEERIRHLEKQLKQAHQSHD